VFKIVPADLFDSSQTQGSFGGSPVDLRDGFIHLSTAAQLAETLARYFSGVDNLLIVAVATTGLDVRWEPSRGGDLFPHLYGVLPFASVLWIRALPVGASIESVLQSA
jgi:uncharacterized protein (DUF952 family)